MAQVILSDAADADTEDIFADLSAKAGQRTAAKYDRNFDRLYERLSDHPAIGAPRPGLGQGVRIGIVRPYIVIYRHDRANDEVTILRLVHGRRRITLALLGGAS
jgi:toxin ParE1/3/4